MQCAFIQVYGDDIENLVITERPDLIATGEDIRVNVRATALNRADLLERRGLYPPPAGTPEALKDIPGLEFVGQIDQVGDEVKRWSGGERVFGIVPGGGYASQVVTHESLALEVPECLDDREAAAVPEAFITAYDALVLQCGMKAGERVLIHAAGSGVGTAAVQLANVWGAEVIGTAGSRHKLDKVSEIASFFPINYREKDFKEVIEYEFGKGAIDIVLDVVGADYWQRNIDLLGKRGRLVLVGRLSGSEATTNLAAIMKKRLRIMGTVLRTRTLREKAAVFESFAKEVLPPLNEGKLRPVVDAVFPFEEIHRATARMENNENVGKIVLMFG